MDEPARTQLDTAEIAHDHRTNIEQSGALQNIEHRLARRAGGLAIIGGALHWIRAVNVVDVGRAVVAGVREAVAGAVDKRACFRFRRGAAYEGDKPRALDLNLVLDNLTGGGALIALQHYATRKSYSGVPG